jgi:DNA polymerase
MNERWSDRQREMLAAMEVRLFEAPQPVRAELVEAPAQPEVGPSTSQRERSTTRPDIAVLDWPELRQAVSSCRACALCESRTQTVFGVGHERARLMIVGEAPGEQEDLQGEPFVGQAGKLLDNMLRAIGLARDAQEAERAVFICNTLKCRPPRNRNPDPEETARCAPFLERQIELMQPRLLLAMGRFAAQSLLGTDEAIGKLRGRVHRRNGVPVVVTYHPAYLLRNPADKARAWADLCLAAAQLPPPN